MTPPGPTPPGPTPTNPTDGTRTDIGDILKEQENGSGTPVFDQNKALAKLEEMGVNPAADKSGSKPSDLKDLNPEELGKA